RHCNLLTNEIDPVGSLQTGRNVVPIHDLSLLKIVLTAVGWVRAVTSGLYSNSNRFRSRHQMTLKYLIFFKSLLAVQVFSSFLIDISSWPQRMIICLSALVGSPALR